MEGMVSLKEYLDQWAGADELRKGIAQTIKGIAAGGHAISELISAGPLAGALAEVLGENIGGDAQKALDLRSHDLMLEMLADTPVAWFGSEEADDPVAIHPDTGTVVVAMDPLDGSSNIDTNVSVGTIFSILPVQPDSDRGPLTDLLQPGTEILAAGFIVYGPQTALVISLGEGTLMFTHDHNSGKFFITNDRVDIPREKKEYAINASNYRFWETPIRTYIDDCVAGVEGPREANFNMRWVASLVAEVYRIMVRGGIFLYPRDRRKGYEDGRLRLVYECNPIAFVVEHGGGHATDGEHRILEMKPTELHQRSPLVFGSVDKVDLVTRYHKEPHAIAERSPLFGNRGLLRSGD
ncbi:MAG: class 1 fructose-bisphosphatase [Hyphomicrobiales bacterium]|nr:MAG: class 1 fructose-bisphosphatase [Hyphomicrobiales bacterium]